MRRSSITAACAGLASALWLACAPAAAADGLPVPGVTTDRSGLVSPDGELRYSAFERRGATLLTATDVRGGVVRHTQWLRGRYTIPAVTLEGTPSGLSADGSTLALIRPRDTFPQASTHLLLLDTEGLGPLRPIELQGDFSFDAISPDGSRLFLVHYADPRDPTEYEVRAYDTDERRLLPRPIVDPEEPEEQMGGYPLARATSPDGRWAYTLYDGKPEPFIHALDTEGTTAVCIDLPVDVVSQGQVWRSRLVLGPGGALAIEGKQGTLATVDTQTFEVSVPARASDAKASAPSPTRQAAGEEGLPWLLLGAAAVGLGGLGTLTALALRRRLRRPPEPGWESLAGAEAAKPAAAEDRVTAQR